MAKAYSWTTAETMNTESMAAVRNFLFDSCRDQRERERLAQGSGVRAVQRGICVTRITARVLNYYSSCDMEIQALEHIHCCSASYYMLYVVLDCCIGTVLTQRKSLYP